VISAAHSARVYQYSTSSLTPAKPRSLRYGLTAASHHAAKNIFVAGMFLLNPNACLRGNKPKNFQSALFGSSCQILKGMSNIGVSMVKGRF